MAKKNVIHLDFESPCTVLGIASNEKVWKLCWKVNQALGLNLATQEDGINRYDIPELYQDNHSDPNFDYLLFEQGTKGMKSSKLAKQFRFWLVLRHKRDQAPDVAALTAQLSVIDIVSMVHDLSQEKDIQRLLP